jgi:hypothetical protein
MVMILLILKSRLRARLSSATLGFFGFVSVIHCSLAAEDIFSQNSSLRCSGTLVITALQSGISESETMVEHYHFERGRRDGLIPYRWTKDSISYESATQFQHAGITIERYSVVINRLTALIERVELMQVKPPGYELTHPIERRFTGRCLSVNR